MKKLITGVLVMALTFTFAFAVPVYAAEVGSAEDSETTTTETKETTTATPEAVTTTKASYDAAHGSGAYEKLISEGTAKVNKAVQSKAELAKVTEVLKNAGVDTTKKTIAKPTLKAAKGKVTVSWKRSHSRTQRLEQVSISLHI